MDDLRDVDQLSDAAVAAAFRAEIAYCKEAFGAFCAFLWKPTLARIANDARSRMRSLREPVGRSMPRREPTAGHWMTAFAEQYYRIGDADCLTDFNDLERRARELAAGKDVS